MRLFRYVGMLLAACILVPAGAQVIVTGGVQRPAPSPLNIPRIVVLPTDDFVWHWGDALADDHLEPDFSLDGTEEKFFCNLTGAFGSNAPDEYSLTSTLQFIQIVTARMNNRFRQGSGNSWATLSCAVPDNGSSTEEKVQERTDTALERAERQRERRRDREARNE